MTNKKNVWALKVLLVSALLLFNAATVYADEHEKSAYFTICGPGAGCGVQDCSITNNQLSPGCAQTTGQHYTDWHQLLSNPDSGLTATIGVGGPLIHEGVTLHEGSPGYTGEGPTSEVEVVYYKAEDFMDMGPLDIDPPPVFPIDGFYYKIELTNDWHFVSMGYTESIEEFENLQGYSIGIDNYAIRMEFEGDSYDSLHDVYQLANIESGIHPTGSDVGFYLGEEGKIEGINGHVVDFVGDSSAFGSGNMGYATQASAEDYQFEGLVENRYEYSIGGTEITDTQDNNNIYTLNPNTNLYEKADSNNVIMYLSEQDCEGRDNCLQGTKTYVKSTTTLPFADDPNAEVDIYKPLDNDGSAYVFDGADLKYELVQNLQGGWAQINVYSFNNLPPRIPSDSLVEITLADGSKIELGADFYDGYVVGREGRFDGSQFKDDEAFTWDFDSTTKTYTATKGDDTKELRYDDGYSTYYQLEYSNGELSQASVVFSSIETYTDASGTAWFTQFDVNDIEGLNEQGDKLLLADNLAQNGGRLVSYDDEVLTYWFATGGSTDQQVNPLEVEANAANFDGIGLISQIETVGDSETVTVNYDFSECTVCSANDIVQKSVPDAITNPDDYSIIIGGVEATLHNGEYYPNTAFDQNGALIQGSERILMTSDTEIVISKELKYETYSKRFDSQTLSSEITITRTYGDSEQITSGNVIYTHEGTTEELSFTNIGVFDEVVASFELASQTWVETSVGEGFTDTNDNGIWDEGEPFVDADGDGEWDGESVFEQQEIPGQQALSPAQILQVVEVLDLQNLDSDYELEVQIYSEDLTGWTVKDGEGNVVTEAFNADQGGGISELQVFNYDSEENVISGQTIGSDEAGNTLYRKVYDENGGWYYESDALGESATGILDSNGNCICGCDGSEGCGGPLSFSENAVKLRNHNWQRGFTGKIDRVVDWMYGGAMYVSGYASAVYEGASFGQQIHHLFHKNDDSWITNYDERFDQAIIGSSYYSDRACANQLLSEETGSAMSLVKVDGDSVVPTYVDGVPMFLDSNGNFLVGLTINAEKSPLIEHPNGTVERLYKIAYTVSAVNAEVVYNFELVCDNTRHEVFDDDITVLKGDSDSRTGGLIHMFYSDKECTKAALHIISGAGQYNNLDSSNRLETPFVLTERHGELYTGPDVGEIPGLWPDVDYTEAIESGEVTEEEVEESEESQSQTPNYP